MTSAMERSAPRFSSHPPSLRILLPLLFLLQCQLHPGCAAPRQATPATTVEPLLIFGDGESASFDFIESGGTLFIPVTLPALGRKYFLLDTGWGGPSALRSDIVKAMGAEKVKVRKGYDVGGKITLVTWKVKEARIAGRRYAPFPVATCEGFDRLLRSLSWTRDGETHEVVGVLSIRVMEKFFVEIDLDAGRVTFDPEIPEQGSCRAPRSGIDGGDPATIFIPFSYIAGTIRAETRLNDLPFLLTLKLDTGSTVTMIIEEILRNLGEETAGALGFSGETEESRWLAAADVRTFRGEDVRLASISVGEARLEDFPFTMTAGTTLRKRNPNRWTDGILGMDFLRHFNIRLDLKNQCIALERNRNYDLREEIRLGEGPERQE